MNGPHETAAATPRDEIDARLSAYLDGELPQQERQRVERLLDQSAAWREAYDDLSRLRSQIGQLSSPQPSDNEWSLTMTRMTVNTSRGIGWLLWGGGLLVLILYGLYEFLRNPTIAAIERVGVLAVVLGVVFMFISVIIERIRDFPRDRYRDIQR